MNTTAEPDSQPLRVASRLRVLLAWGVHALTASGAVLGAVALVFIGRGELAPAALLMLATLGIDSVDGTLARAVGVTRAAPKIDGRRLDDIVDFFNYAIVPPLFMLAAGSLDHWLWAAPPILASCYGFSQRDAKTEDDFFLGWPSYWNVVALCLWLLGIEPPWSAALVLLLSAAVLVPLKYVYPSRVRVWRGPTNAGGLAWIALVAWAVLDPARAEAWHLAGWSLVYPAYYLVMSAWLGDWLGRRG